MPATGSGQLPADRCGAGTLIWSYTTQVPVGDVFQLQDELIQRIVERCLYRSLSRTPDASDLRARPMRAYEYFLRGNHFSLDAKQWGAARDLYLRMRRGRSGLRAGVGPPGRIPMSWRSTSRPGSARNWIEQNRHSAGHSISIQTLRSLISFTPNSRSISGARPTPWRACQSGAKRGPGVVRRTGESCATAACLRHPSLLTRRRVALDHDSDERAAYVVPAARP